jgi:hypothetical protein
MPAMREIIAAVEAVIATPAYQGVPWPAPPHIAGRAPGARGVCFGYDFHLVGGEPR